MTYNVETVKTMKAFVAEVDNFSDFSCVHSRPPEAQKISAKFGTLGSPTAALASTEFISHLLYTQSQVVRLP